MPWIEIIELRSATSTRKQLETQLLEFFGQVEKKTEQQTIKLFTRFKIDSDISIHLLHHSSNAISEGSPLGMRLASILKPYGLVNHSIWIERQKIHPLNPSGRRKK